MIRFGFHPVREALRSEPGTVQTVWVARGRDDRRRRQIADLCAQAGVPLEEAAESFLEELAGEVHNGFVARLSGQGLEGSAQAGPDEDLRVLLEDVQDPRNLGALLRVSEGAGVGKVLIRDRGSAPLTATVAKTSAGASSWVTTERITNSSRALEGLKQEGFWVYGLAGGGDPPWEVDLRGKVVLCLGGEEKGLRSLTRKNCDRLIGLPMRGRVESLNVATAAAAVLYEAVRQRST